MRQSSPLPCIAQSWYLITENTTRSEILHTILDWKENSPKSLVSPNRAGIFECYLSPWGLEPSVMDPRPPVCSYFSFCILWWLSLQAEGQNLSCSQLVSLRAAANYVRKHIYLHLSLNFLQLYKISKIGIYFFISYTFRAVVICAQICIYYRLMTPINMHQVIIPACFCSWY